MQPVLLTLVLCCCSCLAQEHRFLDAKAKVVLPAFVLAQGLDAWTTERFMTDRVHHESNVLVPATTAGRVAYFSLTAAGVVGGAWLLHRSGHHRLERMLEFASLGIEAQASANNLIVYRGFSTK